jgi:hypothetical protein
MIVAILFETTRCVGCQFCIVACKLVNGLLRGSSSDFLTTGALRSRGPDTDLAMDESGDESGFGWVWNSALPGLVEERRAGAIVLTFRGDRPVRAGNCAGSSDSLAPVALSPGARGAGGAFCSRRAGDHRFSLNRLNVSITGLEYSAQAHYFPKWTEVAVTLSMGGTGFVCFALAARYLHVCEPD